MPQIDYNTGRLASDRPAVKTYHHTHYRPRVDYRTPPPQPRRADHGHSSRYELYLYHKANGTLPVYCAMFGIDYTPD